MKTLFSRILLAQVVAVVLAWWLSRRSTAAAEAQWRPRVDELESSLGEARTALAEAETLPEDQRIVVVLKYYGGYRASEIASIVDMPGATVRSHLRRGLKALRKELDT